MSEIKQGGLWFVGAWGGVATSAAIGISALAKELARPTGLATACEPFRRLPFMEWSEIVVGGHDIRTGDLRSSAIELHRSTGVFSIALLKECEADLLEWSENVRPGLVRRSGTPVERFANWKGPDELGSASQQADQLADDIRQFQARHQLDHVVVANVSSSEPQADPALQGMSSDQFAKLLDDPTFALPASAVYALAAVRAQAGFINFTPSIGLSVPALEKMAVDAGVCYCGKDGKTGETLMKSVLAPMFARRNLQVLSWVGHNILGNRDGLVLQDPLNKQGKMDAKDKLLGEMLGYDPQTLVSIEYISSLGDRKTAWDHIHFEGFLGTQMTLQFIWQGCDSLLAAPLLLDLFRWMDLARRRKESGCLRHLAAYFKTPMHVLEHDFSLQWKLLEDYARAAAGKN